MYNFYFTWSGRPRLRSRRSRQNRCYELERLETRTALSVGPSPVQAFNGSVAPLVDSSTVLPSPAIVKIIEEVWTAHKTGGVSPTSLGELGTNQDTSSIRLLAEAFSSLVPVHSDLIAGLAGVLAVFGQEYRNGISIPSLVDNSAAVIGSAPSEIPPQAITLGVSAAIAAQKAGFRLSTTVPYLNNIPADETQIGAWIANAVGQLDARSGAGKSTPVSSTPPSFLLPLGDFVLSNLVSIYADSFKNEQTLSEPAGVPSSLVSPQQITFTGGGRWAGSPVASYTVPDESGRALSQGAAYLKEEFQVTYDASEITADPMANVRETHGSLEESSYLDDYLQDIERYVDPEGSVLLEDFADAASPAAVTTGKLPLEILLGKRLLPAEGESSAIEDSAKLTLFEDSWFAIVATLRTVPSESRSDSAEGYVASEGRGDDEIYPVLSPSVSFILDVDRALENSREGSLEAVRAIEGLPGQDGSSVFCDERLEGRCPIIPAGVTSEKPSRTDEGVSQRDSLSCSPQTGIATEEAPVSATGLRWACVASIAGVILGWFWAGRRRWRRLLESLVRMSMLALTGKEPCTDDIPKESSVRDNLSLTLRTRPRGEQFPS